MTTPNPNEKIEKIGSGTLKTSYDEKGRIIRAEGKSDKYSASLHVDYYVPKAGFSNSFGDTAVWEGGKEQADASYGTWEQSSTNKKTLEEWVKERIEMIRAGLK